MAQWAIEILLGVVLALVGWSANRAHAILDKNTDALDDLSARLSSLELKVSEKYMTHAQAQESQTALLTAIKDIDGRMAVRMADLREDMRERSESTKSSIEGLRGSLKDAFALINTKADK